ncbi:hypothetical protein ACHAXS_014034 [Conticribra weissflogii]
MQYYTFDLDEESQELCVTITPFGKYKYKCLPMDLKCVPNFVPQIMEEVLCGLDNFKIYLDNIGVFGMTWEEHQILLNEVLSRLEASGLTINPIKCVWTIQDTNRLGYWLTPTGLKP